MFQLKLPSHYGGDFSDYDEQREQSMADEGGVSAAEVEAQMEEPMPEIEEEKDRPLRIVPSPEGDPGPDPSEPSTQPTRQDWRDFATVLAALALVGFYAYRDYISPGGRRGSRLKSLK